MITSHDMPVLRGVCRVFEGHSTTITYSILVHHAAAASGVLLLDSFACISRGGAGRVGQSS